MSRRKRLTLGLAVFFGVALVAAGIASAAAGEISDDPTETTQSTQVTRPPVTSDDTQDDAQVLDATTTTAPDGEQEADLEEPTDPEEGTFGQIISDLRAAGDHTPAAIIMGKDVPGWDPAKHPGSTTDTIAYPPGKTDGDEAEHGETDDDGGEQADGDGTQEEDEGDEPGASGTHGKSGKDHKSK